MTEMQSRISCLAVLGAGQSLGFATLLGVIALIGCGGGGDNSGGGTQSTPATISSVSVSCASSSVTTGKAAQCTATVTGTGSYSNGVTWAVNGTSGGSTTFGAINSEGLYQAPATAPSQYIVSISAISSQDSTESGTFSLLIAGTIASISKPILGSAGGTITLPGGNSVTIPAGVLSGDTTVTLSLQSTPIQPTNTLFQGLGPSLAMSFSPAIGTAMRPSRVLPNTTSTSPTITAVLQGGQGIPTTQLQGALGVMDVNNGADNFFALPSAYDTTANLTTLQIDPSMIAIGSTLTLSTSLPMTSSLTSSGDAHLLVWNNIKYQFDQPPTTSANYCPPTASRRILVVIHGMLSDVQGTFGTTNQPPSVSWSQYASSSYDAVLGINYSWTHDITASAQSAANIINSLFDSTSSISPCKYQGTFDIEAHSEGTIVTLSLAQKGFLTSNVESKLKHVVLVAGPLDGTPIASEPLDYLTFYLNISPPSMADLIPAAISTFLPFISGLQPNSPTVQNAQKAAKANYSSVEIIAVGGDNQNLDKWWQTWLTQSVLSGTPNDGIIPVNSALPTDSALPNLVRLQSNDPAVGDYPYPFNHTNLVNNPKVMPDIFAALNGEGATALVTLNISPTQPTVNVQQLLPITAAAANVLNPQITWQLVGGTAPGSINTTQGASITYTAPSIAGGPYQAQASLSAFPISANANITVANQAGTVTVAPSSVILPAAATEQFGANVTGGGAVTWSVQGGSAGGSISSVGLYSAPSATGTYHVLATNSADSTETAIATVIVVAALPISTIHSFNRATEGAVPWSAPIFGPGGNLYGATETGGTGTCGYISSLQGCGTIYESDVQGHTTTLHSFAGSDGAYPEASLTGLGSDGLYGTTAFGGLNTTECVVAGTSVYSGCGSVFSYSASEGFSSVYSFGPYNGGLGISPEGTLVPVSGILYGTNVVGGQGVCNGTVGGVSQPNCGTVFQMSSSNSLSSLYEFDGSRGAYPAVGLLPESGSFFGTSVGGGNLACNSYATPGCGTVFQMNQTGTATPTVIHSFDQQDGAAPYAKLILGTDGYIYGTTLFGGTRACSGGAQWQGCGTVFKTDASGNNFKVLYNFSGPDGAYPDELIQASDGYFYGTTESGGEPSCKGRYGPGCGTIFRMDSSGNVTILYSFTGQSDGSWPESAPVQGPDGNLYGTTAYGGMYDDGVLYEITNLASLSAAVSRPSVQILKTTPILPSLVRHEHMALPRATIAQQR